MRVFAAAAIVGLFLGGAGAAGAQEIGIEVRAGTVVALTNRLTGEKLVAGPRTGSPRLGAIVLEGAPPLSAATATFQQMRAFADGRMRITLAWTGGAGEATLATVVSRVAGTREMEIEQQVASGNLHVSGIVWGIADIPDRYEVLVPGNSGQRFGRDAPTGVRTFDYPMGWEAQFVLIQGARGGVLVYAPDATQGFKQLTVEHVGHAFRLKFEWRAEAPFTQWDLHTVAQWRIRAYRGPWHVGAALYSAWARKSLGLTPLASHSPAWAKDIRFVAIVDMSIPTIERLAKSVDATQTLLYVPNWRRDGYDRNYPEYTALPEFGPFVAAAHRLGFRVMPHVNYFGCDPKNPLYATFAKWQMHDPFSNEALWWDWALADPPIKFAYINPASREWRKLFVSRMVELCRKYAVDALHLDQTLCMFNDRNGRVDGMNCIEGNVALHRELRQSLPNVALSGEGLNEVTCRYEAFAQRHVTGVDFIAGTWDDRALDMAHPISSSLLLPHTTMYGYLGMPNPQGSPGTFMAWQRAYEHFGVIPTMPWPTVAQLDGTNALVQSVLAQARFRQRSKPVPSFAPTWKPDELFVYRTAAGLRAAYARDRGVVLKVDYVHGPVTVISRRIEGVRSITIGGSVDGWAAYDAERIVGLNPRQSYAWSPRPRDLTAPHVSAIPAGFTLARTGIHPEFARFGFERVAPEDLAGTIRLWEFAGTATCGVSLSAGKTGRYQGSSFEDTASGGMVRPEGEALFMHPPWKGRTVRNTDPTKPNGVGDSYIAYAITVPKAAKVTFRAGAHLRAQAVGKSDGVTFGVTATWGGASMTVTRHVAGASAEPLDLDLTSLAGQRIELRLVVDPGPAGDASFDWGLLDKPMVFVDESRPHTVEVAVAGVPPGVQPLDGEGTASVVGRSGSTVRMYTRLPGAIVLPKREPASVTVPLDLLLAPHTIYTLAENGIEGGPPLYGPAIGDATCGGMTKRSLHEHPPDHGRTLLDYWLRLPATPCVLRSWVGIRDGSKSNGVAFEVEANGKRLLRKEMNTGGGWMPVEVDLSAYAGKEVLLTLITDSMGDFNFDWAVWGEARVEAGDR